MFDDEVAAAGRLAVVRPILDVVCQMTGMRFAAVARVSEARWVACSVRDELGFGMTAGHELDIKTTFCDTVRAQNEPILIDDVTTDPVYHDHVIPAMYNFRSYISVPIRRPDGAFFGTLCALDVNAVTVKGGGVLGMFQLFANLIGEHLQAQEALALSKAELANERQLAVLREQFIAVLGHDLRAPLGSMTAATAVLRRTPLEPRAAAVVGLMEKSTWRMARLVNDILDFARGRLGDGLRLQRTCNPALATELEHVVAELRAAWPERRIEASIALAVPIACDGARIGQLVSNLVGNALQHGAPDRPVRVAMTSSAQGLEIAVFNEGEPIPQAVQAALFEPFTRSTADPGAEGLGLGLFIVAEIARAHGGDVSVQSDTDGTRFSFRMPAR